MFKKYSNNDNLIWNTVITSVITDSYSDSDSDSAKIKNMLH